MITIIQNLQGKIDRLLTLFDYPEALKKSNTENQSKFSKLKESLNSLIAEQQLNLDTLESMIEGNIDVDKSLITTIQNLQGKIDRLVTLFKYPDDLHEKINKNKLRLTTLQEKEKILTAMNAAIFSKTKYSLGKEDKEDNLISLKNKFSHAKTSEESNQYLADFIKEAMRHRTWSIFRNQTDPKQSTTASMVAFRLALGQEILTKIISELPKTHEDTQENTRAHSPGGKF